MNRVVTVSLITALVIGPLLAANDAEADYGHPHCHAAITKTCPKNESFDPQTVQVQLLDPNVLGLLTNPGGPVERRQVQSRSRH